MTVTALARSLTADGRLSLRDADKLIAEAKKTQGTEEVKKVLADTTLSGVMAPEARKRLSDFVSAAAPTGGALGVLPDATKVFVKDGVFVAAADAALPSTPAAYGQGLYRAARVFAEPGQDVAAKLSVAEKSAVVDRTLVGLKQCAAGPNTPAGYAGPSQAAQQRSASATVLREIMGSLKGADPQGKLLQDKCLKTLVDLVQKETVPGLRDHMSFHLNALKDTLATPEQKALVDSAFTKFAPVTPPYDAWFKGGNATLNVVCHTGGEFFDSEVKSWKADGFKVAQEGDWSKPTILEKDMAGPNGAVTKVRLRMVNGDSGTFDDMKDANTHVVVYSGHSGWGKNMPRQLRNAPAMTDPPKVMLIHQCCGQGIINKVRDTYPEADLVTTRYSSYENEDHFAFKTFLEGVAGRSSWDNIHDKIAGSSWNNSRNNYLTPADEFSRMKVYDRDHDGKADLLDKLYDFDTFDVPGDTATAFTPGTASNREKVLGGRKVETTSAIINTTLGFSEFLEHMERPNPFVGGGYFYPEAGSADESKMVRIQEKKLDLAGMGLDAKRANVSGNTQPVYEIQLNNRFAHASEEVVKAVGFMEVGLKFGTGSTLGERGLQALILAAHSLSVDEEFGREQEIFQNLLKYYGLPDTLSYQDASKYLSADAHVYAGSEKGMEQWRDRLGADSMKKIGEALKAKGFT